MTSAFPGGSVGTLSEVFIWRYGGWTGIAMQMLLFSLAILWVFVKERIKDFG